MVKMLRAVRTEKPNPGSGFSSALSSVLSSVYNGDHNPYMLNGLHGLHHRIGAYNRTFQGCVEMLILSQPEPRNFPAEFAEFSFRFGSDGQSTGMTSILFYK